jgi:uncharacterized protein (DUF2141 family)
MGRVAALLVSIGLAGCGKATVPPPDVPPGVTATVTVVVAGVRNDVGSMMLAVYDSADGFPSDSTKAVRRIVRPCEADSMVFVLPDVPAGVYAVSVLHDENSDGKMATDFWGRPSEGYGFSRNARGFMGPPGFDKAAFALAAEPLTVRMELSY